MPRHARKLVTAEGEVVGRSGKLVHLTIALSGSSIWQLREGSISGNPIYKIDNGLNRVHQDLNLSFKDALFAEELSGSTGELNVIYE